MKKFKLSKGLVMVVSIFIVLIIFIGVMSEKSENNESNESPVVEENIPDNSEPEEEYVPKDPQQYLIVVVHDKYYLQM